MFRRLSLEYFIKNILSKETLEKYLKRNRKENTENIQIVALVQPYKRLY